MQIKFTVIKNEDVEKHLDELDKSELCRILRKIQNSRLEEGKSALNTYLVVNTDEDYAGDILRLLQENGHWGPTHDPNQVEFRQEGDTMELPEVKNPV
ncbi:hypothetical protein C161_27623 [Paenibacillus sp. FSL R5-192]|uniref:hypothetical protein n=1 Tax=Paenibacillus sp. FSL R5-192 TaxID=1226754 RepID=UPI0003E1CD60|nr:hypothetical protein [Paenibacillus sp. FSL R5-192]ETT30298.1 hypothetical protein C161_27623 [Paenibacillus sp. FSL R5-192]